MYTFSELTAEVQSVLESLDDEPRWSAVWITQEVLNRHPDIDGNDSDFYVCMTRSSVRDHVRKHLNRYKLNPETQIHPDKQIVMAGFERLQKRYALTDGEDEVLIQTQTATDVQLLTKADELDRMGEGCHQHAQEIRRYVATRTRAIA